MFGAMERVSRSQTQAPGWIAGTLMETQNTEGEAGLGGREADDG